MPVVQNAKLRIRRFERSADLPDNLDPGEFALGLDTGKLVVGGSFGNIEVYTDENQALIDAEFNTRMRDIDRAYHQANVAVTNGSFVPLVYLESGDPVIVTTNTLGMAVARVSYFVLQGTKPIRSGVLTVVANDSIQQPMLTDEYVADAVNRPVPPYNIAQPTYDVVSFGSNLNNSTRQVGLTVKNDSGATVSVFFRVERLIT